MQLPRENTLRLIIHKDTTDATSQVASQPSTSNAMMSAETHHTYTLDIDISNGSANRARENLEQESNKTVKEVRVYTLVTPRELCHHDIAIWYYFMQKKVEYSVLNSYAPLQPMQIYNRDI